MLTESGNQTVICDACDAALKAEYRYSPANRRHEIRVEPHFCSAVAQPAPAPAPAAGRERSKREMLLDEATGVVERLRAWPGGFSDAMSSRTVGQLLDAADNVITALQRELAETVPA